MKKQMTEKSNKNNVGAGASACPNNRGITLIALVITIIVMLILVGVTISMAVNGGLFDYAGKAAGDTNNAIKAEQQLANGGIEVDGIWYDSIDDYLKGKPATTTIHNWTRNGDTFTCSHCNVEYEMGDVVAYTATGTTTLYVERLGLDPKNYGGSELKLSSQNTTWIVLGIEDSNGDGTNETLLITSAGPVGALVDGGEIAKLPIQGAAAYNNGPSEINRMCEELYSNSEYGTARGMTIEDVNEALNYTPLGGYYQDGSTVYTTENYTTKLKDLPIFNSLKAGGTYTPDGANTETALGEYELNGYSYDIASKVTTVEKNVIFGADEKYTYWLASSSVVASADYAAFGPGLVYFGFASSCFETFKSDGGGGDYGISIRPVVSLTDKLPVVE